ncbi:MAG: THAP domain-containing protein, partial [bacterium]|nr:THAP domain-containing protein [bacterium]
MAKNVVNEANLAEDHCPSFFQNSCPGSGDTEDAEIAEESTRSAEDVDGPNSTSRRSGGLGGFTCCVPNCFSNSKKNKNLSFYAFPNGKSKEKQLLRKRWTHFISRKDFKPTIGHRVCSEHFPGGKKTYMNNVPTVTPKTANAKPLVERSTYRARNRGTVESTETEIQDQMEGEEILQ